MGARLNWDGREGGQERQKKLPYQVNAAPSYNKHKEHKKEHL